MKRCFQLIVMLSLLFYFVACSSGKHVIGRNNVIDVSGKVVDSANKPVAGASVVLRGGNRGTITDTNGSFLLQKVPSKNSIMISYVGYLPKTIPVSSSKLLPIVLYPIPANDRNKKIIICSISRKLLLSEAIVFHN